MPIFAPKARRLRGLSALIALLLVLGCWLGVVASASAAPVVTFRPSFGAGSQLGQSTTWSGELTVSGSEYHGTVAPLTKLLVHLPAGVGGSSVGFPVCDRATLENEGPTGCPAGSMAGSLGSVSFADAIGNQLVTETGTIQAVFGAAQELLFYIQATAPIAFEIVATASYVPDASPYGRLLTLELPLIASVPGAPYVSTTALNLNLGATREEGGTVVSSVTMPSTCPDGQFA